MNFLMRSTQTVPAEQLPGSKTSSSTHYTGKHAVTLEGLMAEDSSRQGSLAENEGDTQVAGAGNENAAGESAKSDFLVTGKHPDVSDTEGWIAIPYNVSDTQYAIIEELPDDWHDAPDIQSLKSLDRSFVFPGEQVHILACLSAYKQDTEVITPFKVAAMMSKNGRWKSSKKENGNMENGSNLVHEIGDVSPDQAIDQNGEDTPCVISDTQKEVITGESLLRMEDYKRQTKALLQRFEDSHFFVRIADAGDALWSKKGSSDKIPVASEMVDLKTSGNETQRTIEDKSYINAVIDQGNFDANVSGGLARNSAKCLSLSNGDLVVLLEVNVGMDCLNDPVIEILQFEKHHGRKLSAENQDNIGYQNIDPCGELLKWLLPLDNTISPPARPVSPPQISPSGGLNTSSHKPSLSASSGSQLFSFGNFRSYSMSSLPQSTTPSPVTVKNVLPKPNIDLDDWDQFSSQKFPKSQKSGTEKLLSFRGVSLERERFSVSCGLEGIYVPGRRWRKNIEIIQPLEIKSFAAECNTDDLLCVQIKNVSPPHTPNIILYIDAITIVYEEASKGGPSSSLPIACIEAGTDHSLPNLPLRKGEEHSFILKATSMWRNLKVDGEKSFLSSKLVAGNEALESHLSSKPVDGKRVASNTDQYSIMISCRCNYTESRLFFKKPTSWQPRISRDFLISVASEMSRHSYGANGNVYQLPVQVLTLQVSNLTSADLTLTVLAPASVTSIPSVVSLNPTPSSLSSFVGYSDFTGRLVGDRHNMPMQRLSSAPVSSEKQNGDVGIRSVSFNEQASLPMGIISNTGSSCTHLWLQSRVPLGSVPRQSTATIKLELLPLTDGIITVDTLQIHVKEKGITYIPEHPLKINATSSISTGML